MSAHDSDTTANSGLLAGSTIVATLQSIQETFRPRLSALSSWAGRVIRSSVLYRWLTTEPEPEVIVIDLRRTRTVGPFIAILDRIVETVAPYFEDSQLKNGLDIVAAGINTLAETRAGELIVTLFEPPAAPEQAEQTNHNDDSKSE